MQSCRDLVLLQCQHLLCLVRFAVLGRCFHIHWRHCSSWVQSGGAGRVVWKFGQLLKHHNVVDKCRAWRDPTRRIPLQFFGLSNVMKGWEFPEWWVGRFLLNWSTVTVSSSRCRFQSIPRGWAVSGFNLMCVINCGFFSMASMYEFTSVLVPAPVDKSSSSITSEAYEFSHIWYLELIFSTYGTDNKSNSWLYISTNRSRTAWSTPSSPIP